MSWFGFNRKNQNQNQYSSLPNAQDSNTPELNDDSDNQQQNPQNLSKNPHYVNILNSFKGVNVPIDAVNLNDPNSIRKLQSLEHCFINCISAFSVGDRVMNSAVNMYRRNVSSDADKKNKMNSNKEYRQKMIIKALENVLARARADPNIGSVSVSNTISGDFTQLYNLGKHGFRSLTSRKSPQQLPQGGKKRRGRKTKKHLKKSK